MESPNAIRPPKRRLRIIVALILAGLLVALGIEGYLYLFVQRPAGEGPAGPVLHAELFQRTWSGDRVWIIGLGDSVTAGFGARPGYSYFDRLVVSPADDFPEMKSVNLKHVLPRLIATNLAVSGSTSFQLLTKQLPRLPAINPPTKVIVVITTGGNDLIHDYGRSAPREDAMYGATFDQAQPWIASFEQRLTAIIQIIQQKYPEHGWIFLANIYDPTDGVGDIHRASPHLPKWPEAKRILDAYNQVIAKMASRHKMVRMVNIHQVFLGHGIHCTQFWQPTYQRQDPHYWFHENIEDPNERGYDTLRRVFLTEMGVVHRQ